MGFVDRMAQNMAKQKIGIWMKEWLLNGLCCYSEVLGSLLFLAFQRGVYNAIFLKYSKEGRSSSSHEKIQNVPLDFSYRCYPKTPQV